MVAPVAARLRLLRADPHPGLGPDPHGPGVHRADGPPRLRPLRRAGRRLGQPGRDPDRRPRPGPLRRPPPQHGDRPPPQGGRRAQPPRTRPTSPRWRRSSKDESGYSQVQGTRPQTLGAGLNDSPAGLLAWIVEKFRAWSDCDGDPENAFTRDQLLTNVMLYWVTETITSSTRLYWELQHARRDARRYVTVPTGVARYPKEPIRFPRPWVERRLQRDALGRDAPRRPLRRPGAARPVRRGRPRLLLDGALSQ